MWCLVHLSNLSSSRYMGFKYNIDASFLFYMNHVRICMCIRHDESCLSLQKNICFSPVCNVDVGEALNLFYALHCWFYELHHNFFLFCSWLEKNCCMLQQWSEWHYTILVMWCWNVGIVLLLILKTLVRSLVVDKLM